MGTAARCLMSEKARDLAVFVFVLSVFFGALFLSHGIANAQNYGDSQMVYMMGEINRLRDKMDVMVDSLAGAREEIAEMRGRQRVTTGVAAGTPTGLAGLFAAWWFRREKKRNGGKG